MHARFIEYGSGRDAEDAVRKLDGTELMGAVVTVTADVRSSQCLLTSSFNDGPR